MSMKGTIEELARDDDARKQDSLGNDDGDRGNAKGVLLSNEFKTAFENFESRINPITQFRNAKPSRIYEEEASLNKPGMKESPDDRLILAEIAGIRKDVEGEDNLIVLMGKYQKRKNGSTKTVLTKREEFFMKKYKRGVTEMLNPDSKFYFVKYLKPSNENDLY